MTRNGASAEVMIVDDSPEFLRSISTILARAGLECRPVRDGGHAFDAAMLEPPQLILLDIEMQHASGFDVCRKLKQQPRLAEIPVIFVSSRAGIADKVEAFRVGGVDYVTKPIQDEDLVARIRVHLQLYADRVDSATENRELRRAQEHARIRLEALSRAARDALILVDSNGCIAHWNEAAERMFGYSPGQAIGQELHRLVAPEHRHEPASEQMAQFAGSGQGDALGKTLELAGRRKDGTEFPVELSLASTVIDAKHWAVGVVRDITDRKRAEEVLRRERDERQRMEAELNHAQKLEAIGRLAAGIAHEINTPAQFVTDNTHFIRDSFVDIIRMLEAAKSLTTHDGPSPECLAEMRQLLDSLDVDFLTSEMPKAFEQTLDGLSRITKIVGAMKEFSRPSNSVKTPVDLNRAIESTIMVSRNEWKYVADVVTDLMPDMPAVVCLGDEINQVVLNLIVNGAHAIGDKVQSVPGAKGTILVSSSACDGFAEIRIKDSGGGIPENIRQRIFEPFFTTKPVGKGTGQGLAIARSIIVDKHHGSLDFETELGQGTTFIIRLPLEGAPS